MDGRLSPPLEENPRSDRLRKSWQLFPFYLAIWAIFFVAAARLFQLQVFQGAYYSSLSEDNRLRSSLIRAERGVIYDSDGQLLVRNRPGFRVAIEVPKVASIQDDAAIWEKLGQLLSLSPEDIERELREAMENNLAQVTLASAVEYGVALEVESNLWRWPMVLVEVDPVRYYPLGPAASHLLGYVGEISQEELEAKRWYHYSLGDWTGKVGLELEYDQVLHGRDGVRVFETEAGGRSLRELSRQEPEMGLAIKTSLKSDLIEAAYRSLEKMVGETGAVGGALVAQRVSNGEVLALVSYPSYDSNIFSRQLSFAEYQSLVEDPRQPMFDRAIGAIYPPGSVFKIIVGSAFLDEGVVTPTTSIFDEGGITVGSFSFADWKPGGHAEVDFVRALAVSCDTYFYIFGGGYNMYPGIGPERIADWSRRYGFGKKTGIDIPSEAPGLVPDPSWKQETLGEPWYLGNTYHYAIGQGDLAATPLQVNNATVAVANGGVLYRPRIVSAVLYSLGEIKKEYPVEIINQDFVSSETLSWVREGMRQAVLEGGTAYPLRDFPIECGAKTGTAEFGHPEDKTHAWFTAFCPFDRPEIAVTAVLEEGGEGSHHAGPVVRKVMETFFKDKLKDL